MIIGYTPASALLVVDMQHDFADPSGSLYVAGGEGIVAGIAAEITAAQRAGGIVVYTQDWHPPHTPHFAADGGIWPVHCVADSPGAALVPGLPVVGPVVRKGIGMQDGYSGFSEVDLASGATCGTPLSTVLDEAGVMSVVVVGLAGDWCVRATALDGIRLGYDVTVPLALTRFVNLHDGDGDRAVADMREAGVTVTG